MRRPCAWKALLLPAIEAEKLSDIAERLAAAVREAGALAHSLFQTPLKNWTKGPTESPVSEADIAVDKLLRERLNGVDDSFAWLSEESADDPNRLSARHVWIVDPIDGTRAYIAGLPDWAVSVALIEDGRPIVACLYAPAMDAFFMARNKAGATRNGTPIAATKGENLKDLRIAGPRSLMERLSGVMPSFTAIPRVRSLALRLAQVAQGTCDIAFAGGNSHDWDLAATDLLVHEAGGALTPFGGESVTYNRPVPRHGMLVAAGRDRHAALIELLGDGRLAFS
jgi:myo-inositol-1(or 4)-monophosphatase